MRQHASACVSMRQQTSAYVSMRQHTSAYVSIRQHTSACVSIRQHTSAYVSACHLIRVLGAQTASMPRTQQPTGTLAGNGAHAADVVLPVVAGPGPGLPEGAQVLVPPLMPRRVRAFQVLQYLREVFLSTREVL